MAVVVRWPGCPAARDVEGGSLLLPQQPFQFVVSRFSGLVVSLRVAADFLTSRSGEIHFSSSEDARARDEEGPRTGPLKYVAVSRAVVFRHAANPSSCWPEKNERSLLRCFLLLAWPPPLLRLPVLVYIPGAERSLEKWALAEARRRPAGSPPTALPQPVERPRCSCCCNAVRCSIPALCLSVRRVVFWVRSAGLLLLTTCCWSSCYPR